MIRYTLYSLVLLLGFFPQLFSQDNFIIEMNEIDDNTIPGVHSYSWGKAIDGKWIIIGGRIEGLHQRQPFASFAEEDNNKTIYIIDPSTRSLWSAQLDQLNSNLYEQLQSTNQQFYQKNNTLYIIGGYGYSDSQNDHITYPYLTAVDIEGLKEAIINNEPINSFFRQIENTSFAVTGGQLGYLDNTFYLCGGQYFEGRYNPMGPDHGPGFIQEYSDEIRKFKIEDDGTLLEITDYSAIKDSDELHRRDYNMSPQVFPDGSHGFTMFSGVFQHIEDLPFLNTVDVTESGYKVKENFNQYLSQYHSAKIPIYDVKNNIMHTVFFGGMSQYFYNGTGDLIKDDNVPFVNTISIVSRASDGSMKESKLDIEMPGLLGSGAEFIPVLDDDLLINNDIVDLSKLSDDKVLIGYIYGGIESSQANIFFQNTGSESIASNKVFEVYIIKTSTGVKDKIENNDINFNVYPNPSNDMLNIEYSSNHISDILVYDSLGKLLLQKKVLSNFGKNLFEINISSFPNGEYNLLLKGSNIIYNEKIIISR